VGDATHEHDGEWKISMDLAMTNVPSSFRFLWLRCLFACLLLGLTDCQVTLISPYDPEMDKAATALQKKMDAFLTNLETHAGLPQVDYTWNIPFYDDYLVELRSLHLRAQSQPKNEEITKQLKLMMDNLRQLRLAHEAGSLAFPTIQALRGLFNQGWQAIISVEIARRQGENPLYTR
jgi:hypothetical protein